MPQKYAVSESYEIYAANSLRTDTKGEIIETNESICMKLNKRI